MRTRTEKIERALITDCLFTLEQEIKENHTMQLKSLVWEYATTTIKVSPNENFHMKDGNTIHKTTAETFARIFNKPFFKN